MRKKDYAKQIGFPRDYTLYQNFPNPFNSMTEIKYVLPEARHVSVRIFDLLGRESATLVSGRKEAGYHIIQWDGNDNSGKQVTSGTYLYQIQTEDFTKTKKMLLLR